MWEFTEMSGAEVEVLRRRYDPLTASIRELIDAALRSGADDGATVTAEGVFIVLRQ